MRMLDFAARHSLLRRHLTRGIGWSQIFSKPIHRLKPIERPAEEATKGKTYFAIRDKKSYPTNSFFNQNWSLKRVGNNILMFQQQWFSKDLRSFDRHTEGRLSQKKRNRCHAMIRHQNADAMVLASALMRDIPHWTFAILNIIRGVNASHKRTG